MFDDLDATLRAVLDDAAAPADLRGADISFATPDKAYSPSQSTLNIFLHDVTENRELRDEARVVQRTDGTYTSRLPSLRVDCSYLVTAWSARTAGLQAQEEHRLLGQALVWLSRFPVVDDRFLQGSLQTPAQPYPVPAVIAHTKEGQTMGQFWSALGISPRPAFSVTVTIALEPFDVVDEFAAVQHIRVESTLLDDPVLRGRVTDHLLAPIPGAGVGVVGSGGEVLAEQITDRLGRFTFPGLGFGPCLLRVAVGDRLIEQAATYLGDRQVHDVLVPEA